MSAAHVHRVARAVWFVERHLFDELTAERISAAVGGAVSELHRQFTAVYGISVMAYVRARRLSEAAQQLVRTRYEILEVAVRCGYGSQAAFTRAFHRQFGMPPARFRQLGPASYRRIQAPDLAALAHRAGLERVPVSRRLHEPVLHYGIAAHLDADDTEAYEALAVELRGRVGSVRATGILRGLDGRTFDAFVGVETEVAGLEHQTPLPAGLYAVFEHRGPAERMRDTLAFVAEALDLDLAAVTGRPHAERFSLAEVDGPDLKVELWIAAARGRPGEVD